MRALLFAMLLLPCVARAQDAQRFERALRGPQAMDRWMKKEIHRQRKGQVITTPSTSYVVHRATFDGLVAFLQRQPGVENAAWDRCTNKIMLWPGHSTIGVRVMLDGAVHERCYRVQEGIPGTLRLPGWRPHVRRDREHLKFLGASECEGFVEAERARCAGR